MAEPDDSEIDYIRRYGDNPNAPTPPATAGIAPVTDASLAGGVTAVDRAAPYNPTQDVLNAGAISGTVAGGTLPGVGGPGSTDVTDQTNLNVAAAMERADLAGRVAQPVPSIASTAMDEYAGARQSIDQQRRDIMARLGIIKPQDAGYSAMVLASPRDRKQLIENLGVLEDQSNALLREHHYAATEAARQAHEELTRTTHIQTATGLQKLFNGINQAHQQFGIGSPEARNAILGLAASGDPDINAALASKNGPTLLKPYTDLHDVSAERIKSARDAFKTATGQEPSAVEITATGGINIRGRTQEKAGTVPAKTIADYTTLKANRAEQQAYLDQEVDTTKQAGLKKTISAIDAQLGAVEQQFPQLNPNKPAATAAGTTPTGEAAPTIPATVPAAAQRKVGQKYPTPRGPMTWTGTGWLAP